MVRLQVQLEQAQHRRVRQRARRLGVSVSEIIRRSVDAELRRDDSADPDGPARRALAAAGRYAESGGSRRTAADHDDALAGAYKS
jgi:post-segregation antitoxin (ccd killing protein)